MFVNKFRFNNIILDQSSSVIKGMVFILLGVNSFVKMNVWDSWLEWLDGYSTIFVNQECSSGHFDTQSITDKTLLLTFVLEKRKSEEMFLTDWCVSIL